MVTKYIDSLTLVTSCLGVSSIISMFGVAINLKNENFGHAISYGILWIFVMIGMVTMLECV